MLPSIAPIRGAFEYNGITFSAFQQASIPWRHHTVKKLLALLCLLSITLTLTAKTMYIYKGDSTNNWDVIATYKDGCLYKGDSTNNWDSIATYRDGMFYKEQSTSCFDIIANYKDDHLYKEGGSSFSYILATYVEGRICRQDRTYHDDTAASFQNNKVYKGENIVDWDCLMNFSSTPPKAILVFCVYYFHKELFKE